MTELRAEDGLTALMYAETDAAPPSNVDLTQVVRDGKRRKRRRSLLPPAVAAVTVFAVSVAVVLTGGLQPNTLPAPGGPSPVNVTDTKLDYQRVNGEVMAALRSVEPRLRWDSTWAYIGKTQHEDSPLFQARGRLLVDDVAGRFGLEFRRPALGDPTCPPFEIVDVSCTTEELLSGDTIVTSVATPTPPDGQPGYITYRLTVYRADGVLVSIMINNNGIATHGTAEVPTGVAPPLSVHQLREFALDPRLASIRA